MELKSGYRQTEVGVIPEDWRYLPITKVARLESGHTPSKRIPSYWGGTVSWISLFDTQGLSKNEISATEKTITEEGLNNSSARLLPAGTVVFSRTATVGKTSIMALPMATSQDFANYICGPDLHNTYLVYLFRSMGRTWKSLMAGSIHNTIYMPTFKTLTITVPPLSEQYAIAEALSDADALIESLEQLLIKKRQIKQGAMQELLTGQRRLPGFSGEWELRRLGELAELYQPITISAKDFKESGFPVYGANGVVGFYDQSNHETWQVTVTCRGSTCGTVNRTVDRCWITGNAMVLNCDDNSSIDKEFFYQLLCNQNLSDCITGTGQPQIVRAPLSGVVVYLPSSFQEQVAIASILSDTDNEITTLETQLQKARQLKQGMMQELLTGRIRLV